jgi:hypothetical protein
VLWNSGISLGGVIAFICEIESLKDLISQGGFQSCSGSHEPAATMEDEVLVAPGLPRL